MNSIKYFKLGYSKTTIKKNSDLTLNKRPDQTSFSCCTYSVPTSTEMNDKEVNNLSNLLPVSYGRGSP